LQSICEGYNQLSITFRFYRKRGREKKSILNESEKNRVRKIERERERERERGREKERDEEKERVKLISKQAPTEDFIVYISFVSFDLEKHHRALTFQMFKTL
jgi:hypothetical protein